VAVTRDSWLVQTPVRIAHSRTPVFCLQDGLRRDSTTRNAEPWIEGCAHEILPLRDVLDILPAASGEDSYGTGGSDSSACFGGFLLHRSALLRRISTGFTSGLSSPRSFGHEDDRTKPKEKERAFPRPETPRPYGPKGNRDGRDCSKRSLVTGSDPTQRVFEASRNPYVQARRKHA